MRKFLHVGCGLNSKERTTDGFNTDEWTEIRFDINKSVTPDLVGTMTDMGSVKDGEVDAIFSSHNIEHLYPHEVLLALHEFLRVLRSEGFAVITCPDLKSISALIVEDKLTDPAYSSPAGDIAPIDILYGWRDDLAKGNLHMAHRCGFTEKVLRAELISAGFESVATAARGAPFFDLWAVAVKEKVSNDALRELALSHFPIKNN